MLNVKKQGKECPRFRLRAHICQLNNYKPKQLELQGFSMLPNQFTFTEWVHSSSLSLNTVTTEITIIRLVGAVYGKKKKQKA